MNMMFLANRARFLLNQNSSVIFTGIGVAGTVGTAYLTGRASFKAADVIWDKQRMLALEALREDMPATNFEDKTTLSKKEKVMLVWKEFIPPVGVGSLTIGSIIVAHRIDAKKIMALTVASGVSERAFKEYKEKVVEKLGGNQAGKIQDDIAQDRVTKNPPSTNELVLAGDGKVLCLDMLTGRYFMSSAEELKRAQNTLNGNLIHHLSASLSEFFDEIGLSPTSYSDTVGWNADQMLELNISTTLSVDNRPCLAVDYHPHPFPEYGKLFT